MANSADQEQSVPQEKAKRRRRRPLITTIVLLSLVALVIIVPRLAAGWLAEQQLDALGIESEGASSLKVDLLNSEIDLGTVEFWSADAERGRIENLSLQYNLRNIIFGRAVVDRMVIRGVDIRLDRGDDGSIELNGIPLDEFFAGPDEEVAESEVDEDEQQGAGFGVGLNSFLLEDSRALITTATGSELAIDIERLLVADIRSWQPDHAAIVGLTAAINDIVLSAEAQAHLFTETIMVDAHVRLESIHLDKIERFVGPLGFERRDGDLRANLVTSLQIESDGRVVAGAYGDFSQEDATIVRPDLEYNVANQRIDLDVVAVSEPEVAEDGDNSGSTIRASANLRVNSRDVTVATEAAGRIAYDRVTGHLADIALMRADNGQIRVSASPSLTLHAPSVSGPLSLEVARIDLGFDTVEANLIGEVIDLLVDGNIQFEEVSGALPEGSDGTAGPTFRSAGLKSTLGGLAIASSPDKTEVSGQIGVDVDGFAASAASPTGENQIGAGPVAADVTELELAMSADGIGLAGQLALDLGDVSLTAPNADGQDNSATLEAIEARLQNIDLTLDSDGRPDVSGQPALSLANVTADVALPDGKASVSFFSFEATLDDLVVAQPAEEMEIVASGSLSMNELDSTVVGALPLRLQVSSAETTFAGTDVALTPDGTSHFSAPFEFAISDLNVELPVGDVAADVTMGSLQLALSQMDVAAGGTATSVQAAGTQKLDALAIRMPASGGLPPVKLDLASMAVDLDELAAEAGQGDPSWQVASSITLDSLAAGVEGDGAASLRLGSLDVDTLRADDALAINVSSIGLGGFKTEFSNQTLAAFAGDGTEEPEASSSAPEAGPEPMIKIDSFAIEPPASVRFEDTSFEPLVEVETVFDQLEITEIDTGNASQESVFALAATINEVATVDLAGSANLANQQDFDIQLDLANLQLPTFSPYVAGAVGLDMESGVLGTSAQTTAAGGRLEGQIDVEVDDLILIAANEESAEAASAAVGMPVGMAVGMLEDSDGLIKLGFPVSGTVDEPVVGIQEVVSKAITASMAAVFPPTALAGLFTDEGNFELSPMAFEAGSAELPSDEGDSIDNLLTLLENKPNLEVLICGRATAADAGPPADNGENAATKPATTNDEVGLDDGDPAQQDEPRTDPAMVELAQERALAVQTYLQEEHDLPDLRIRECRPRFDPTDSGPPRVDFTLT